MEGKGQVAGGRGVKWDWAFAYFRIDWRRKEGIIPELGRAKAEAARAMEEREKISVK